MQTFGSLHSRGVPELTQGYIGVSLFFVLSGFILTYTYIVGEATLRGGSANFWRARFARIYPVYIFALLLSAPLFVKRFATSPVSAMETGHAALGALLTPLLLQAWWPTAACQWNCAAWSLSAETFFYALFPILGIWLARKSPKVVLIAASAIWLISLVWPVLYLWIAPDGAAHVTERTKLFWLMGLKYNPLVHVGEFSVGIFCGLIFLRRSGRETSFMTHAWIGFVMLASIAVLMLSNWVPYPLLHSGILAPLFAILIYNLACRDAFGIQTIVSSPTMVCAIPVASVHHRLLLHHRTTPGY
jgi:peptidoglycan/LPS O-acetylase OafA/YrhL